MDFRVPDWVGLTAPEMVEACARGELDLLYCLGGNFLRTLPEPEYVRQALANVPMRVHQDIILTDQMLIEAKEEVIVAAGKNALRTGRWRNRNDHRTAGDLQSGNPQAGRRGTRGMENSARLGTAVAPERAHLFGCETGWEMREEIARVVPFYDGFQH